MRHKHMQELTVVEPVLDHERKTLFKKNNFWEVKYVRSCMIGIAT